MILAHLAGYNILTYNALALQEGKCKNKPHPVTGRSWRPQGGGVISSTLPLTPMPDGVGGQSHTLAALTPGKRPNIHWIQGCVHPQGRYGQELNPCPHQFSNLGRPALCESLYHLHYPGHHFTNEHGTADQYQLIWEFMYQLRWMEPSFITKQMRVVSICLTHMPWVG